MQNLQNKVSTLTINQILSFSNEDVKSDIFKGVQKSKIIQFARYNIYTGVITRYDLYDMGIETEIQYIEDDKRSYTKLKVVELDIKQLRAYFITKRDKVVICHE